MTVSPSGRYAVMQRNTQSILFDVGAKSYEVLPFRVVRIAFLDGKDVAVAVTDAPSIVPVGGANLQVLDATTGLARGTAALTTSATYASEIKGKGAILVVGETSCPAHKPSTPVARVRL